MPNNMTNNMTNNVTSNITNNMTNCCCCCVPTTGQVDEAVVAQAYSWIRKSGDDGLKGMVEILQRVLQLYGAFALVPKCKPTDPEGTAARALEEVLAADVEDWPRLLKVY